MKSHSYCLALIAIAVSNVPIRGDSIASPYTFKEVSENGKFVFVMLAPESMNEELKGYNEKHQKVIRDIRERYIKSGMYRNDGTNNPLWTVDWYAYGIVLGNDGVHAIQYSRLPGLENQGHLATKKDLEQKAFSIFSKGKLIRSFKISELVDDPALLEVSVSHFHWVRKGKINDDQHRYEIDTYDGNHVTIDLETGAILTKVHQPIPRRKPEVREAAPARKWLGNVADLKLMSECKDGLITQERDFANVWKALRGEEKIPKIDFLKEFVLVSTLKGWNILDVGFNAPEYEDDNVATESKSTRSGDSIDGFSYAIAVFNRDRLELVNGKVLVKDKKR
jgi:hypothetical protein